MVPQHDLRRPARRPRLRRAGQSRTPATPPLTAADQATTSADDALTAWFLTAAERGNPATTIQPWTTGSTARPLVHGGPYFAALADAVDATGAGDLVLFTGWRVDPDELVRDDGTTITSLLADAARRGVTVKGLVWRSQSDRWRFARRQNKRFVQEVNAAGAHMLLDHRVRRFGSHHQKAVVARYRDRRESDRAFLGGIDVAHSRRDDADHGGDAQPMAFNTWYGGAPAWHDVQLEVRGPAVREVEEVFRERWADPAALSRRPDHRLGPRVDGASTSGPLPPAFPAPDPVGTCAVQLLRTYPHRRPPHPFAPEGERSVARGYLKAFGRARRLVYLEDQYLWSTNVASVLAEALRRAPDLHLVALVPRFPEQDAELMVPVALHGHAQALEMVHAAGGDRVLVLDVENLAGRPVYVHSKVCVVDDVWATVGSDNFNRRSWTHDSELTAAVLDEQRDPRAPLDPAGLGDGARTFARDLRLELWREHLDLAPDGSDDDLLLDPAVALATLRTRVGALDAWYDGGCRGPRPPGRLRTHRTTPPGPWQKLLASTPYRAFVDPDGRPPSLKVRGEH